MRNPGPDPKGNDRHYLPSSVIISRNNFNYKHFDKKTSGSLGESMHKESRMKILLGKVSISREEEQTNVEIGIFIHGTIPYLRSKTFLVSLDNHGLAAGRIWNKFFNVNFIFVGILLELFLHGRIAFISQVHFRNTQHLNQFYDLVS